MALIRLLVPVAGDLAEGVPAPPHGAPVEVPDSVADSWCDGERAERVEVAVTADVEAVHAGAREYLAAVQAQHEAELEAVHAGAREYLAAVEAQHAETVNAAPQPAKPAAKAKA